jgi:tetrahydromethanopterin S-methyltransferase subunit G
MPPLVTVHPGKAEAANAARERIETATQAAWAAGEQEGECTGYRAGWRFGLQLGIFYGVAIGAGSVLAAVEFFRWWLS